MEVFPSLTLCGKTALLSFHSSTLVTFTYFFPTLPSLYFKNDGPPLSLSTFLEIPTFCMFLIKTEVFLYIANINIAVL